MEDTANNVQEVADTVMSLLVEYGLDVVGAIIILIVGYLIAGWAARSTRRALDRSERVDSTLKPLISSVVRYLILIVTLLAVLSQFGIETTSLIAVLGAAGLAVGLALQGTLSNVAAGVMLLILRPFRVGDFVDASGKMGTVESIDLFTTTFRTPDNIFMIVPNGQISNNVIVNFSRNPTRRIDITVGIAYEDEIDKAVAAALDELQNESRILDDPAPSVVVKALGESSVDLAVRGFVNGPDWWPTFTDLQKAIKERFDREGITIPYPQRTVHTLQAAD